MIFGYWEMKGRAEPLRYLFAYLNLKIKEENPKPEYWFKNRSKLGFDFPDLPYLIDSKTKITQTKAILEYILIKNNKKNFLGKNGIEKIYFKMLYGILEEIQNWMNLIIMNKNYKIFYEKLKDFKFKSKFHYLNKYLKNRKFFLEELSYIDIFFFYIAKMLTKLENALCVDVTLENYENLVRLVERIGNLEGIKQYIDNDKRNHYPMMVKYFAKINV